MLHMKSSRTSLVSVKSVTTWVPREFTKAHKSKFVNFGQRLLEHYNDEGEESFESLVIGNEA